MKDDPLIYHGTDDDDDGKPATLCKVDVTARSNTWNRCYNATAPPFLGRMIRVSFLPKTSTPSAPGEVVYGHAFLVQDRDQEETLCCYETGKYEVLRCELNIGDEKVRGLTFRLIGNP
ncbi:hypothetical protein F5X96DRAFT_669784 [Biscogniauxia mediterranea]|nr:hypothetical protein F5X96DRAFT_669784 [Biscogniauxia mediterranea]